MPESKKQISKSNLFRARKRLSNDLKKGGATESSSERIPEFWKKPLSTPGSVSWKPVRCIVSLGNAPDMDETLDSCLVVQVEPVPKTPIRFIARATLSSTTFRSGYFSKEGRAFLPMDNLAYSSPNTISFVFSAAGIDFDFEMDVHQLSESKTITIAPT